MRPGPTLIHTCPSCSKFLSESTISSGNTFGAVYWSDGYVAAPMLPMQHDLVKCPHCQACVWIGSATEAGTIDDDEPDDDAFVRFIESRPAVKLKLADYKACLAAGIADSKKERYVRTMAWWTGNNRRRHKRKSVPPLDDFEIANLRALASVTEHDTLEGLLMKAEIMRELGEFATVETLYKDFFVFPPLHNYAGAYGVVLQLARAGNSRLVIFEDG